MAESVASPAELVTSQVMGELGDMIIHKTISQTRTILLKASFQTLIPNASNDEGGKMTSDEEEEAKPPVKSKVFWVVRLYEKHDVQGLSVRAALIPPEDFAPGDLERIIAASRIRSLDPTIVSPRVQLAYSWNAEATGLVISVLEDHLQICVHEDGSGIHGFGPVVYPEEHQLALEFLNVSLELVARLMKEQEKRRSSEKEAIQADETAPLRPKSKFADMDDRLCEAEHKLEVAHRRLRIKLKRDAKAIIDLKKLLQESKTTSPIALDETTEPEGSGDIIAAEHGDAPYEDAVEAMTAIHAVAVEA